MARDNMTRAEIEDIVSHSDKIRAGIAQLKKDTLAASLEIRQRQIRNFRSGLKKKES